MKGEITSQWGVLSKHLIASFYEVDRNGKFVSLSVPMMLTTLAAIDRQDWSNFTGR